MIGQALVKALVDEGHAVRTLDAVQIRPRFDPVCVVSLQGKFPLEALEGVDVVVHLAAASVGQRWTGSHRRAILESRTLGTHLLREAAGADRVLRHMDSSLRDRHLRPRAAALRRTIHQRPRLPCGCRGGVGACSATRGHHAVSLVRMRLGLVLSPDGGTLAKLLPIYKFGLGAPLGSGQQHMGWIHLEDVIQFITWAAATSEASDAYNVVAPRANTNEEFSQRWPRP